MTFTKLDQADLNSPRRDLSNGGLGIVVTLMVCLKINFACASTGGSIQLYLFWINVKYYSVVVSGMYTCIVRHFESHTIAIPDNTPSIRPACSVLLDNSIFVCAVITS